jgi:hypothetical protein
MDNYSDLLINLANNSTMNSKHAALLIDASGKIINKSFNSVLRACRSKLS